MIERVVEKKYEIRAYLLDLNDKEASLQIPTADHLMDEDWLVLVEVKSLLEPLFFQTKRIEGWDKGDGHGRLWEVITGMEYIFEHLEEWKNYYSYEIGPVIIQEDEDDEEEDQQPFTRNGRILRSSARRPFNESSLPDHVEVDWARRRAKATLQFRRLQKGY
ncbi:transposase-like protein [Colletotrichum musicola]|uniref:Transposase-like protein n=1 Tax=Colletotrichum musicola TaxID=2175873 RepID=A0A8H6MMD8_9PEZI|nr:transposase-like protein [Colletotrichum musicola]